MSHVSETKRNSSSTKYSTLIQRCQYSCWVRLHSKKHTSLLYFKNKVVHHFVFANLHFFAHCLRMCLSTSIDWKMLMWCIETLNFVFFKSNKRFFKRKWHFCYVATTTVPWLSKHICNCYTSNADLFICVNSNRRSKLFVFCQHNNRHFLLLINKLTCTFVSKHTRCCSSTDQWTLVFAVRRCSLKKVHIHTRASLIYIDFSFFRTRTPRPSSRNCMRRQLFLFIVANFDWCLYLLFFLLARNLIYWQINWWKVVNWKKNCGIFKLMYKIGHFLAKK